MFWIIFLVIGGIFAVPFIIKAHRGILWEG